MPLSTIFQLYRDGQFYCRSTQKKPQTTSSHNVVSSTRHLSRIRTHNVRGDTNVGTDCIGSYKSNYHTITTIENGNLN